MSKIKIAVDAGHGSNTAGKRTPPMPVNIDFTGDGVIDVKKGDSIREHYANVGVAVRLAKELEYNGFEVIKSGWDDSNAKDDSDPSLGSRQRLIKSKRCKYSISIHFNAFGTGRSFNSAQGISVFYHTTYYKNSKKLAQTVQSYLKKGTKQVDRGVKQASFAMVNCKNLGTQASVLVELAFMTNENEAVNMMGNAKFWDEAASELCQAFCKLEGKRYKKTGTTKKYYYVMKSFTEQNTRIGAFTSLIYAKRLADKYPGYSVFDSSGKRIYTSSTTTAVVYGMLKEEMNVRTSSSTKGTIITSYKKGTVVKILQILSNGWVKVVCKESSNGVGYISNVKGRYISYSIRSYTVKKGDTLWSIASKQLGSGSKYKVIMSMNQLNTQRIYIGQILYLPK